jgi:hypothetical protein
VVQLDGDRSVTCVTAGLFLVTERDRRIAALVMQGQRGFDEAGLRLEVLAPEQEQAERFLADIRALMREHNVYRGKVLALEGGGEMMNGGLSVEFPAVEPVTREQIILPEGVLDMVELHTVEFARVRETLRDAGWHMRRGLLLHGPPGTGKTLTSTYLISRLEGRTVVILTGSALGLVSEACSIARELQPAMVVLEDVDLVAQERTMMGLGATSLLFQLLNEMDGLGEDADVIFVLTTNRVELLEPALAMRPGRIDQAVEIDLPDEDCRTRLFQLYLRDLPGLDADIDLAPLVAATDGVSAAFIKELTRRAVLLAAVESGDTTTAPAVTASHLAQALAALDAASSPIRRTLLGAHPTANPR